VGWTHLKALGHALQGVEGTTAAAARAGPGQGHQLLVVAVAVAAAAAGSALVQDHQDHHRCQRRHPQHHTPPQQLRRLPPWEMVHHKVGGRVGPHLQQADVQGARCLRGPWAATAEVSRWALTAPAASLGHKQAHAAGRYAVGARPR
jgi:hypothetical protein